MSEERESKRGPEEASAGVTDESSSSADAAASAGVTDESAASAGVDADEGEKERVDEDEAEKERVDADGLPLDRDATIDDVRSTEARHGRIAFGCTLVIVLLILAFFVVRAGVLD